MNFLNIYNEGVIKTIYNEEEMPCGQGNQSDKTSLNQHLHAIWSQYALKCSVIKESLLKNKNKSHHFFKIQNDPKSFDSSKNISHILFQKYVMIRFL